jgi:hypothetical protein
MRSIREKVPIGSSTNFFLTLAEGQVPLPKETLSRLHPALKHGILAAPGNHKGLPPTRNGFMEAKK